MESPHEDAALVCRSDSMFPGVGEGPRGGARGKRPSLRRAGGKARPSFRSPRPGRRRAPQEMPPPDRCGRRRAGRRPPGACRARASARRPRRSRRRVPPRPDRSACGFRRRALDPLESPSMRRAHAREHAGAQLGGHPTLVSCVHAPTEGPEARQDAEQAELAQNRHAYRERHTQKRECAREDQRKDDAPMHDRGDPIPARHPISVRRSVVRPGARDGHACLLHQ